VSDRTLRLGAVVVLLIAAAVYLPGLPGTFVYDDYRLIVRNEGLKRPFDPARAFLRDYYASDVDRRGLGYYRPVAILSNEVDFRRGGGTPGPFHATNIAVHVATTALLMWMARALKPVTPEAVLAAGLLFAVHPAHAESVAFISGRVDPLAAMFGLAVLAIHLRPGENGPSVGRSMATGALWLAALFSKEMAVTVPALAVVLDSAEDGIVPWRRSRAELVRRYGAFAIAGVVYLLMRRVALGGLDPGSSGGSFSLVRPLATLGTYLTWLVLPPRGLHLEPPAPGGAIAAAMGATAIVAVVGTIALWRGGKRLPSALLASTLLTLLPVAQFRVLETAMSERFLYLPSAFACLLLAVVLAQPRVLRAGLAVAATLSVLYTTMLTHRAALWRDEVTLWTTQTREAPASLRAWVSLAQSYVRRGDREAARRVYERAGTLGLDPAVLAAEMTSLLGAAGGQDEEQALLQALEVVPGDGAIWQNLGFVRLEKGDPDGAREAFLKATELVPARSMGWLGLAFAELRRRSWAEAERAAERAAVIDPTLAVARAVQGECLWRQGHACAAVGVLEGLKLDSPDEAAATGRVLQAAREDCARESK